MPQDYPQCWSCLSVFLSQFKLLWSRDAETDPGAEGARDTDGHAQGPAPGGGCSTEGFSLWAGAGAQLDEDGDLAVERRSRAASDPDPAEPRRAKVQPMVLTQQEDDDVAGGDAQDSSPQDVIQIGKGKPDAPATKVTPQRQGTGMCVCCLVRPSQDTLGRTLLRTKSGISASKAEPLSAERAFQNTGPCTRLHKTPPWHRFPSGQSTGDSHCTLLQPRLTLSRAHPAPSPCHLSTLLIVVQDPAMPSPPGSLALGCLGFSL